MHGCKPKTARNMPPSDPSGESELGTQMFLVAAGFDSPLVSYYFIMSPVVYLPVKVGWLRAGEAICYNPHEEYFEAVIM